MKFTLETATILGPMSTSYWPLIGAQGLNTVVGPAGNIKVIYKAGSRPFGGNPSLQIGVPDLPYLWSGNNFSVGFNQDSNRFSFCVPPLFANQALLSFANQPLVISLADASATYGPIATSTLASGGSGYAAGEKVPLDTIEGSGTCVLTVLTVNGSGVILTYTLTLGTETSFAVGTLNTQDDYAKTVILNDGGVDYVAGEVVGVGGTGANAPYYTIDTVDGGGTVLTGHLTLPGWGQTTGTGIGASGGSGTGLLLDVAAIGAGTGAVLQVDAVTQGNGVIDISFDYKLIEVPA